MRLNNHPSRWLCFIVVFAVSVVMLAPLESARAKPVEPPPIKVQKIGEWIGTGDGKAIESPVGFVSEGIKPLAVTHANAGACYIITGDVTFSAGGSVRVTFGPDPPKPNAPATQPVAASEPVLPSTATLALDKDGKTLRLGRASWTLAEPVRATYPLAVYVGSNYASVCLDRISENRTRAPGQTVNVSVILGGGAKVENLKLTPVPVGTLLPVLDAEGEANAIVAGEGATVGKLDPASIAPGVSVIDGVPFYLPAGVKSGLDIAASMSGVKEPLRNKSQVYHDGSLNSNGRLVMSVPSGQYSQLHLIAFSAGRAGHVPRVTVRAGVYAMRAILEDIVVEVPALSTSAPAQGGVPVKLANGTPGFIHHLRIPMAQTNNIKELGKYELEFTRDMNTHVIPPDPNEFGTVPAGLPSDVVILAATLEPSPVTMSYVTDEGGNVFNDTQKVVFKTTVTNRSDKPMKVRAFANAAGPGTGEEIGVETKKIAVEQVENLKPGEAKDVALDVTPGKRGWFTCSVGVESEGKILQRRDTTFAVLAPDTRKAMGDSPYGVWEFWSAHSSVRGPKHNDILGSLILKGGWRWTYGGGPSGGEEAGDEAKRMSEKYKVTWTLRNLKESYQRGAGWFNEEEFKASVPAAIAGSIATGDPHFKVMHESRSSTDLIRRLSEYLGGAPYNMPAAEKEKIDQQFENVKKYCAAVKAANDKAKIVLINDYPEVAMQFLQRGMPKESFDVIGLEGAMFMRAPERQPDWMSLLGNLRQMRLAQEKYGYNKPVWTTEALYHGTEAGNLSLHDQGVIAVREAMMALQLGVARMAAAGLIKDPSDDYHWSNWGSCGYCYREPEINPKPSYAMYAWMTQILDQAKPAGKIAVPNNSLHVVDFKKTDGSHIYSLWTANGVQTVLLKAAGSPVVYDAFGNVVETKAGLKLIVSPTPQYITGATVEAVLEATPVEDKTPVGTIVSDFDKAGEFKIAAVPNKVVESNWDTPRLKGDFESAFVQEEGKSVLKVTLKPDNDARKLLPRYVEYQLEKPLVMQGRPHAFTVRLKGNSGWGQIMFEMVDAKGRVWTSCGNQYGGASNAADPRGYSHVNFEGWKTMWIPIVGMYPTKDQSLYWPDNYNWWPTNTPEDAEREAAIGDSKAKLEAELKAYEQAVDKWEEEHGKWEEAKQAAEKAGKKAPAEPAKPAEPKAKIPRNLGLCPVDYPLTLTKIFVAMRPSILYLDEMRPVTNPTLLIDSLGVLDPPAGR